MPYVNYHKHSMYSNVILPDSTVSNEDYCKRAKELGHTIISSCEHGTAGNYRQCADLAAKYDLKWRYVAEGYFVKDMTQKDKTNCHIILAAKTAKGIGDINFALSQANIDGYYYRPRIDLNVLLGMDPHDVFITTACVGGVWNYDFIKETGVYDWKEADSIIGILYHHFGQSMMLQVQYHNTEKQKTVNQHIIQLHKKYGIKLIAGMDSHFIYPSDSVKRDSLLESRHMKYEDEEGWYMDYPSDDEAIKRFKEQGVLTEAQIMSAMYNTTVFESFENVVLDKSKKLPTIYPHLSQEERNEKYRQIIRQKWLEYRKSVPRQMWDAYQKGIKYEVDTITSTNTSDYFLLDYEIVKRFNQLGGHLTKTGRGSAPSYFTNALLGFSSIDRFALPITMYPDRFISADRLKAGSLPD